MFDVIKGLSFDCTCQACPEQYEVRKDGKEVGYVRLRWGYLAAQAFTCGSYEDARLSKGNETKLVYESNDFDALQGTFHSRKTRIKYLTEIADAINKYLDEQEDDTT